VSLESDKSFASYEEALAHVTGARLPNDTELYWNQGLLDVLFEYRFIRTRRTFLSTRGLGSWMRVVTVVRFLPPGGVVRAFEFTAIRVWSGFDPRRLQAAAAVHRGGVFPHPGRDRHLLFLLCLVIPFRRFRSLIVVVTAFTLAHSITLIASAYNFGPDALWFPPLIETLIAISIVYMRSRTLLESMSGADG